MSLSSTLWGCARWGAVAFFVSATFWNGTPRRVVTTLWAWSEVYVWPPIDAKLAALHDELDRVRPKRAQPAQASSRPTPRQTPIPMPGTRAATEPQPHERSTPTALEAADEPRTEASALEQPQHPWAPTRLLFEQLRRAAGADDREDANTRSDAATLGIDERRQADH